MSTIYVGRTFSISNEYLFSVARDNKNKIIWIEQSYSGTINGKIQ